MALTALHAWEEDAYAHVARWGLPVFRPDELRDSSQTLVQWLQRTGASKVAIHLDVDTVDSDEAALGLGKVPGGLTRADRKSTRLNSSHVANSYAVFCLKKKIELSNTTS